MNNFKPYPKYKDSGVDWLGEVPEHWSSDRLRNSFKFRKGLTITKENLQIGGIPTINYGEVHSKFGFRVSPEEHELKCVAFDYLEKDPKALLIKDDFIFADTSEDLEGSGNFSRYDSETKAFAGYHTIIARNHSLHSSEFLAYLFDSPSFRYQVRCSMKGVKVYSITQSILKDLGLLLPPKSEQIAIANFLDEKVGKIDAAIAQKERLIELLNERKQIIIQNAVTKGLNPKAPMRDSGIEWIGEIPEHWEVKRLCRIFDKVQTGTTPGTSNSRFFDGDISWYNPSDLNELYPRKSAKTISNLALKRGEAKLFPSDSVMIVGIGATCGKTAYLSQEASFNQQITGFHSSSEMNLFCMHSIKCFSAVMLKTASFTTLPILNNQFFHDFEIPIPPHSEQEGISKYIDAQSLKFGEALEKAYEAIEKLKEYKATLINSAVTGKIMVTRSLEDTI